MKQVRLQSGTMDYSNCWGMYSKQHLGVTRIIDQEIGLTADFPLSVGRVEPCSFIAPDANFDYTPIVGGERRANVRAVVEDVMPDFSSFGMRYFLDQHGDWCLARYKVIDDKNVQCELEFFNSSDQPREYYYNLGMQVDHQVTSVSLKKGLTGIWVSAKNYLQIDSYIKAFASGAKQCVTNYFSFGVEKGQLSESFGCWDGDKVVYEVDIPEDYSNATIYFRYVKYGTAPMRWRMTVGGVEKEFEFPQTCTLDSGAWGKSVDFYHEWKVLPVEFGNIKAGKHRFEFATINPVNYDKAQIWLDGFYISQNKFVSSDDCVLLNSDVLTENNDYSAGIAFEDKNEKTQRVSVDAFGRKFYAVVCDDSKYKKAEIIKTDSYIKYLQQEKTSGGKTILHLQSQSVKVQPGQSEKRLFSINLDGDFSKNRLPQYISGCYGRVYPDIPESPYKDLIKYYYDTSWFNFCFPTIVKGRQTAFISPAKHFPTPFSWDAGFASLGMAELCPEFCAAGSAFYLTSQDDEIPYIYSGSPVPTQFYSLWSLFANNQSEDILRHAYKSMSRMYEFFIGWDDVSNTDPTGNGLLTTYNYNYSLGIDDHPIQLWAFKNNKIKDGVYPLILIAQILRAAKIMRNIAYITEQSEDVEKYNSDIEKLEPLIEEQMWDSQSGLYGWLYNDEGTIRRPVVGGCEGDMSGCSMLPIFAGLMNHRKELIDMITDSKRFWTKRGVSSVDMQAPYYTPSGYWNGGIWPVMNWFIWRAMIEAGELTLARQIVINICDTWSEFFRKEHYCGEHFNIAKQQMEGVSNFTGLDTAIVEMHNSYFKPYTVTLPFDAWITSKKVDFDNDIMEFDLHSPFINKDFVDALIVMNHANQKYIIQTDYRIIEASSDRFGYLSFDCPVNKIGSIKIKPSK